jgi:hypothetical protein
VSPTRLLLPLLPALIALLAVQAAQAQLQPLSLLADWRLDRLDWHDTGGLPTNSQFVSPMTACYNWAWGEVALGLNVQAGDTYYAVVAIVNGNSLDALSVAGPSARTVAWSAGPYHVAAVLPDGRLSLWLTAPGQYPRQVILATGLAAGTPLAVTATPPAPPSQPDWRISAAYQDDQGGPVLQVATFNGAGRPLTYTASLRLPDELLSLSYGEYAAGGAGGPAVPSVLFVAAAPEPSMTDNNTASNAYIASYTSQRGWVVSRLRAAGINGGAPFLGSAGTSPNAMIALDEWANAQTYGVLQALSASLMSDGTVSIPLLGPSDQVPTPVDPDVFAWVASARNVNPLSAYSDGRYLYLGELAGRGRAGNELGYQFFNLYDANAQAPPSDSYAITALGATAHWSTGNPLLFFLQDGSPADPATTTLFRLAYSPRQ